MDLVPDRRLALELAGDGDVVHDSGNGDVDQTTASRNIRNTVESRSGSIANSRQARPQRNCRLVVGRPARSSRHRRTRGPRRTRSPPRRSPRPETPPGSNRTGIPGPPRDDRWATGSRSCCGDTGHRVAGVGCAATTGSSVHQEVGVGLLAGPEQRHGERHQGDERGGSADRHVGSAAGAVPVGGPDQEEAAAEGDRGAAGL